MTLTERRLAAARLRNKDSSQAESSLSDLSTWLNTNDGMEWLLDRLGKSDHYTADLYAIQKRQVEVVDFYLHHIIPEAPAIDTVDMLLLTQATGIPRFSYGLLTRGDVFVPELAEKTYYFDTYHPMLEKAREIAMADFRQSTFPDDKSRYQMLLSGTQAFPYPPAIFIGVQTLSPKDAAIHIGSEPALSLYQAVGAVIEA